MRRDSGFTLLEVLVAIVVMGFLLVGLAQGTRFGLRARDSQARMVDADGELDAVDRTLRGLVQAMDPGTPTTAASLAGTSAGMVFTSHLPTAGAAPSALGGELADMRLGLDAGHRLVLTWTPHRHAASLAAAAPPQTETLLDGLARLEIAYLRRDGAGGWRGDWSDGHLPALIRIRLIFAGVDQRHWPDIVEAPRSGPQG